MSGFPKLCFKCLFNCFCVLLILIQFTHVASNNKDQGCWFGQFKCAKTSVCIPLGWVCDGENDCATPQVNDTSDEDERCKKENVCAKNYFRCSDGITCHRISKLCDNSYDCPDFDDEGSFCLTDESVCASANCTHGCKPSPKGGPLCFCDEDQEPNGTHCVTVQVNRCQNDEICDQICNEKNSTIECLCVEGYKKKGNKCFGINVPPKDPPTLIFTNKATLQHVFFNGSLIQSTSIPAETSMDFNHRNETICWAFNGKNASGIYCANAFNFSVRWNYKLPDKFANYYISQMTYEWVSRNWYFLEKNRDTVIACNETLSTCVTLIDPNFFKPKHIALDPLKGLMFVVELGQAGYILSRFNLEGEERYAFGIERFVTPTGIALDMPSQNVYWFDTFSGAIERVNYDGTNQKITFRNNQVKLLHGLSIFEDYIYITSFDENSIVAVHKRNQTLPKFIKANTVRTNSIHVYHRQRQPHAEHPCSVDNGQCEHICIPLYKFTVPTAKCKCMPGFKLTQGKKCTVVKQEPFLLYVRADPGEIKGVSLEANNKQKEVMEPIVGLNFPQFIDFDARTQYIYYTNHLSSPIVRQKIDGSLKQRFWAIGRICQGLAVDWMGRNLYWIGISSIFVARLEDSDIYRQLINSGLSEPRSIVVDPKRGMMYWCDNSIERAYMDGTNREVFVKFESQRLNGLSIDYVGKKLYWWDAYSRKIERISLDGSNREVVVEDESLQHPYGLVYHDNYVYWSEHFQGLIQRFHIPSKTIITLAKDKPPLYQNRIFDASIQTGENECSKNNGGCTDLCLATPTGVVCACRDRLSSSGGRHSSDGSSCGNSSNYTETSGGCKKGEFECVKNLRCIDEKYLCDGDNDCGDGSDEDSSPGGKCEKVQCHSYQFHCDNVRCISNYWVCDGERDCTDGTDEDPNICRNTTCSPNMFTCKISGRCIPTSWTCDSDLDCGEGDTSDENNQCVYLECEAAEFRCANQRCVPLEYVCDGDDDCRDATDEKFCKQKCTGHNEFSCDDNTLCLSNNLKCNGVADCKDETDEMNCAEQENKICHQDEFLCQDGMCIPNSWKCDMKWDCIDRSDELNCNNVTCASNEHLCASQDQCIPKTFICDGHMDCEDESDENGCDGKEMQSCTFPSHLCKNETKCINITQFCDGVPDCLDGSDEGGLCMFDECLEIKTCEYLCQATPEGHICYCPQGLLPTLSGNSCTEIPACEQWGICSQNCMQLKHGHKCYCEPGFMLEPDHYTCKSTDPAEPYIIFSNRHELRSVDLKSMVVKALISGLQNTVAVDFFHSAKGDLIFWTDVVEDKIYRGYVISGSLTNIEVVVQTGLATAEGLAVDWIGENLYWVESNLDQIEVAKLTGKHRRTLIASNMENPRAIALDPRYGMLFWTDWDTSAPRIERASMSGEGRSIICRVGTDNAWPNGLTLDYVALRVYWIDARSDSIHTITYSGKDHREVLRNHESLSHPFSITLFGNYVYWTDWRTNSVLRANKWNGTDIRVVQRAITQPFDIFVYHPARQPTGNGSNPCKDNNGGCSHLCLLSFNNTRACDCPHLMSLASDKKTCYKNEKVLLFTRQNEIRGVELTMPYYNMIPPVSLPKVIKVHQIDFVASRHQIYWSDGELSEVKRANLSGSSVQTLIDTVLDKPDGFAVDWSSQNLFVTSSGKNPRIIASNLDGEYIVNIITEELNSPRSLAVDPFEGLLFWSDHKEESDHVIEMSSMDGSNRRILISESQDSDLNLPESKNNLKFFNSDLFMEL